MNALNPETQPQARYILPSFIEHSSFGVKESNPYNKLFEERIIDRVTGRQVNPNMDFYKLGGIEDMPKIIVHMLDMPERGVIGIGEPPTISTHAAIGNAIFDATGRRFQSLPVTQTMLKGALA